MNDSKWIAESGITSAIIIDDGYDLTPRTEELANEDAWEILFDDALGENEATLKSVYHKFDRNEREAMRADQDFVNALWKNKGELGEMVDELFLSYSDKSKTNSKFLRSAEAALDALEISYSVHGRDFLEAAKDADLILVDLYLGTQQAEDEYRFTVNGLKEAMVARDECEPPAIILMSQVDLMTEKSKDFRTDVGLHASGFRFIQKENILQKGGLEGLIITLATHRADSHRLASFLHTWTVEAKEAVQKTETELRKIDIDDLQHTKSIMLSVESLNASSYMLDVFDRVLQNQIEANPSVVEAAKALDAIAINPQPLTLAQHKDPFELIERTIYVNLERVKQHTGAYWPITFGDIIALRSGSSPKPHGHFGGKEDLVFFVASPECDLIRDDNKLTTVLLILGRLFRLTVGQRLRQAEGRVTPIFVGPDNGRYQIEWDFGHHISLTLKKVQNWLGKNGDGQVAARMRDITASSLRQRFMSGFGRIGEPAPPPRSFTVNINLFYPARDGKLVELEVEGEAITGLCLVNGKRNNSNLIIDQHFEPHLFAKIISLLESSVKKGSWTKIQKAFEHATFREFFRGGLHKVGHPIKSKTDARVQVRKPSDVEGEPSYDDIIIGTVVMSDDVISTLGGGLSNAGLIFQVSENT